MPETTHGRGDAAPRLDRAVGRFERSIVVHAGSAYRAYRGVFAYALLVSLAAYGIALFNAGLSIDEELHALDFGADPRWIAQDRWGMFVVSWVLMPRPAVPFLPLLIGIVANALTATILVSMWGRRGTLRDCITATFVVATPVSAFVHHFDTVQYGFYVGLLAAVVAVRMFVAGGALRALAALALLTFAVSVYQATLLGAGCAYLIWILGARVMDGDAEEGPWRIVRGAALFSVWATAGAGLHKVSAIAARSLFADGDGYSLVDDFYSGTLPYDAGALGRSVRDALLGGSWYMGWQTPVLVGVSAFIVLCRLVGVGTAGRGAWIRGVIGAAALAVAMICPFLMVIATGFSWPMRTMLAVPVLIAGLVSVAMGTRSSIGRVVLVLTAVTCGLHYVSSNNRLLYADLLSWWSDRDLAIRLQERIAMTGAPGRGPYRVVVIGSGPTPETPVLRREETIGGSIFAWDQGNPWRVTKLLRVLGSDGAEAPIMPDDYLAAIGIAGEMPAWPDPGSVISIGDVVVIKFGDLTYVQRVSIERSGGVVPEAGSPP